MAGDLWSELTWQWRAGCDGGLEGGGGGCRVAVVLEQATFQRVRWREKERQAWTGWGDGL